jgi:hypothetical protein
MWNSERAFSGLNPGKLLLMFEMLACRRFWAEFMAGCFWGCW